MEIKFMSGRERAWGWLPQSVRKLLGIPEPINLTGMAPTDRIRKRLEELKLNTPDPSLDAELRKADDFTKEHQATYGTGSGPTND